MTGIAPGHRECGRKGAIHVSITATTASGVGLCFCNTYIPARGMQCCTAVSLQRAGVGGRESAREERHCTKLANEWANFFVLFCVGAGAGDHRQG